jgi:hypothetical protein
MNNMIAPMLIWLVINTSIAFYLKGAGFLIIPVISSLIMLLYFVFTQKSSWLLNLILAIPTLAILAPFIQMFPVGLGLKILVGSAVLTVLSFTLLLPIFGTITNKNRWSMLFLLLSIGLFVKAHQSSGYVYGKAKPNSLVYVLNADTNKANWATYDTNLDEWTKGYLGEKPKDAKSLNTNKMYSKYSSQYTFMANAEVKNVAKPTIEFLKDSTIGSRRYLKIVITPNRKVNRYDIFSNSEITNLKANGVKSIDLESKISGKVSNKMLSYYVVDDIPLELQFSISSSEKLDMNLVESSFDLMTNPQFSMAKRRNWMIPTPFVLTDAVIIKQKIKPTPIVEIVE